MGPSVGTSSSGASDCMTALAMLSAKLSSRPISTRWVGPSNVASARRETISTVSSVSPSLITEMVSLTSAAAGTASGSISRPASTITAPRTRADNNDADMSAPSNEQNAVITAGTSGMT